MARKSAVTLEEKRNEIKRTYRRGRKVETRIVSEGAMTDIDRAVKKEAACFLKAGGFSYSYIAEALNTTKAIVTAWFQEEGVKARYVEIHEDYIDGAVKLLRTYAIELIEMLVEIARYTADDKIAIQAITEALDRMGLSKVNKSESAATVQTKTEVDLTDKQGLVAALKDAPPEVQQQAAKQMEELLALTAEHTNKDVTV